MIRQYHQLQMHQTATRGRAIWVLAETEAPRGVIPLSRSRRQLSLAHAFSVGRFHHMHAWLLFRCGYHDISLLATIHFEKQQLTSKGLPIDGARGSMARPGTKNTGNHLAKMAAPGLNTSKAASPNPGRMSSATTMSANNMQHPPSWEGKGISYLAKSLRRTMSMIMKYAAPVICLEESEAAAPPRVAVAAAAVDSVDTTGVSRPKTATPDLTLAGAAALERGTARVGAPTADDDRASTAARHRAEAQRKAKENLMVGRDVTTSSKPCVTL